MRSVLQKIKMYYRGETLLTDYHYTNDPYSKAIIEKDKKLKNKKKQLTHKFNFIIVL